MSIFLTPELLQIQGLKTVRIKRIKKFTITLLAQKTNAIITST